jgi:hypothetical protein
MSHVGRIVLAVRFNVPVNLGRPVVCARSLLSILCPERPKQNQSRQPNETQLACPAISFSSTCFPCDRPMPPGSRLLPSPPSSRRTRRPPWLAPSLTVTAPPPRNAFRLLFFPINGRAPFRFARRGTSWRRWSAASTTAPPQDVGQGAYYNLFFYGLVLVLAFLEFLR